MAARGASLLAHTAFPQQARPRPLTLRASLQRPALFVLVGLVPIVSGLRRGFPVPGLRLSEALITGVGVLVLAVVERRRALPWRTYDWWVLAYVVATLVLGVTNLLRRGVPLTSEDLQTLLGPLQFLILYRAVATAADTPQLRRWCVRVLLLASLPVSALAIVQSLTPFGKSLVATITGLDFLAAQPGETFRATGPFPLWHNLGGYLAVVALICIGLLLRSTPGVLSRRWLTIVLAAALIALVQARSFAPAAGLLTGAALLGVALRRFGRVAVIAAVALVAVVAAFGPLVQARVSQQFDAPIGSDRPAYVPQTLQYRYEHWTQTQLPVLSGRWLMGYGPDLPPALRDFPYNESLYFSLLLRGGVLLLAVFLALMLALWGMARRSARTDDDLQAVLARVLAASVIVFLILDMVEAYLMGSGTTHLFWVVAGLVAAPALRVRPLARAPGERRWPLAVAPPGAAAGPAEAAPAPGAARR